jgi:hypothetical protein
MQKGLLNSRPFVFSGQSALVDPYKDHRTALGFIVKEVTQATL